MLNKDIDNDILDFLFSHPGNQTSKKIADGVGLDATDVAKRLFDLNRRNLVLKSKAGAKNKNVYQHRDGVEPVAPDKAANEKAEPDKKTENSVVAKVETPIIEEKPEYDSLHKSFGDLEERLNKPALVITDKGLKIGVLGRLADLLSDDIAVVLERIIIDLENA